MSADGKILIERLWIANLRNLAAAEIELSAGLNVIYGDNGHGKTSILEAAYLVATTKSFRVSRARETRAHGADEMRVRAVFSERRGDLPTLERTQTLSLAGTALQASIDGNRIASLAAYAARSPVVVFHPGDLELSSGPAAGRRKLLDRLALYARPSDALHVAEYERAMRGRQELLRRGVERGADIDAYEAICARAGAKVTEARARAAHAIASNVLDSFLRIGDPELELRVTFQPGGSSNENEAVSELANRRDRDARSRVATWGPHKDDLALKLDGHLARRVASQGQHRALTLALKAAEAATVRATTGLEPIQLLDDVSSELDPDRTRALLASLASSKAQILLSTTRLELIREHFPADFETRAFHVVRGQISTAREKPSLLDPTA